MRCEEQYSQATCCWHYGPEDSFVLRARVPIQPGDELTISYIGDEELFKSTNVRRQRLQGELFSSATSRVISVGWLFTCHCHRCDEPVDYARGLRCIQCHAGVVCPYTEWKVRRWRGVTIHMPQCFRALNARGGTDGAPHLAHSVEHSWTNLIWRRWRLSSNSSICRLQGY